MPMHPVTVRRWEVAIAFALLTAVFVIGLTWVQNTSNDAHTAANIASKAAAVANKTAKRADKLAISNQKLINEACERRRKLVSVVGAILILEQNESLHENAHALKMLKKAAEEYAAIGANHCP